MATKSQGTKLYLKDAASPASFVLITGAQGFDSSGGDAEKVPTTNIGDTEPSSVAGMPQPVTMTVEVNYDFADAGCVALDALKASGGSTIFKQVFNGPVTRYFDGEILSWNALPSASQNSVLKKNLSITVNNVRDTE